MAMPDTTQGAQSDAERARRVLVEWSVDQSVMSPATLSRWYKGTTYGRWPDKTQLGTLGMDALGDGWLPAEPLISRATRVVAIGSCFARYFILWLAEHGFNESIRQSPYNALLRFGSLFESPASIAQQFRWAFGELDDKAVLWIDKNKEVLSIRGTAATGARHFAGDRRPHCYIRIIGSLVRPCHGRAVVAGTSGRSIRSRAPCLSGGDNGTNSP